MLTNIVAQNFRKPEQDFNKTLYCIFWFLYPISVLLLFAFEKMFLKIQKNWFFYLFQSAN